MTERQRRELQEEIDFVTNATIEELDAALERANYQYWKTVGPIIDPTKPLTVPWDARLDDEPSQYRVPVTSGTLIREEFPDMPLYPYRTTRQSEPGDEYALAV